MRPVRFLSVNVAVGGIEARRYEIACGEGHLSAAGCAEFGVDPADGPARPILLEVADRAVAIVDLATPDVADTVQHLTHEVITSIVWSTE